MALHVNYEIRWKNFRSFEDTGWIILRPLTILIGPNNSGKSSIISPILLLNQTMSSRDHVTPLVTRGPLLDAGTFKDIVHNREIERELFFGLRYHTHDPSSELKEVGSYAPGATEVTLAAGPQSQEIVLKRFEIFDIYKRRFLRHYLNKSGAYALRGLEQNRMKKEEQNSNEKY